MKKILMIPIIVCLISSACNSSSKVSQTPTAVPELSSMATAKITTGPTATSTMNATQVADAKEMDDYYATQDAEAALPIMKIASGTLDYGFLIKYDPNIWERVPRKWDPTMISKEIKTKNGTECTLTLGHPAFWGSGEGMSDQDIPTPDKADLGGGTVYLDFNGDDKNNGIHLVDYAISQVGGKNVNLEYRSFVATSPIGKYADCRQLVRDVLGTIQVVDGSVDEVQWNHPDESQLGIMTSTPNPTKQIGESSFLGVGNKTIEFSSFKSSNNNFQLTFDSSIWYLALSPRPGSSFAFATLDNENKYVCNILSNPINMIHLPDNLTSVSDAPKKGFNGVNYFVIPDNSIPFKDVLSFYYIPVNNPDAFELNVYGDNNEDCQTKAIPILASLKSK